MVEYTYYFEMSAPNIHSGHIMITSRLNTKDTVEVHLGSCALILLAGSVQAGGVKAGDYHSHRPMRQ